MDVIPSFRQKCPPRPTNRIRLTAGRRGRRDQPLARPIRARVDLEVPVAAPSDRLGPVPRSRPGRRPELTVDMARIERSGRSSISPARAVPRTSASVSPIHVLSRRTDVDVPETVRMCSVSAAESRFRLARRKRRRDRSRHPDAAGRGGIAALHHQRDPTSARRSSGGSQEQNAGSHCLKTSCRSRASRPSPSARTAYAAGRGRRPRAPRRRKAAPRCPTRPPRSDRSRHRIHRSRGRRRCTRHHHRRRPVMRNSQLHRPGFPGPLDSARAPSASCCGRRTHVVPVTCLIFTVSMIGFADPLVTTMHTSSSDAKVQLWTCGMHPNVIQEAGHLPEFCQMDLVPLRHEPTRARHRAATVWTCPMHNVISRPEVRPICGWIWSRW